MRAKPIALTINNYPLDSCNEGYQTEDIELEGPTALHYNKLGHGKKVSPKLHRNNYVGDANTKLKRQHCQNVFLTCSCILSLAALALVCAFLLGFIEPLNAQKTSDSPCEAAGSTGNVDLVYTIQCVHLHYTKQALY